MQWLVVLMSPWLAIAMMNGVAGAEPLPRVKPLEPAEAVKSFRCQHGFEMQLLAAEPLVTDPVAMDYDEQGRAFVCEMTDYPYTDKTTDKPFVERTMDLPIGRVRMLQDLDGDGLFDKSTLFAEGLSWPTGLAFWKGGVYVAATPDIWYFQDTDGDGRADVRRKVFTGFRKFNVQAVMNNLKWGLDGCIYGAGSSNGGSITHADRPNEPPVVLGRHDFRFDPRTERFELVSGGARFGLAFDDWGNRFLCNIRNPVQHVVLPSEYLARQPFLPVRAVLNDAAPAGDTLPVFRISPTETWRAVRARRFVLEPGQTNPRSETTPDGYFTSSSGITIYRGSKYPPELHGNAFVGEVAANAIHRQRLIPDGPTFRAERADENCEFVASTDIWFRPVNFVNAPDGTLHVLDMYRETIEHPWSIPDDIKAQLDLESGRDRGRIYRLAPPGFTVPKPPRLGTASVEELVATLERPDSWWRETAQRLLVQRQEMKAVPLLRRLVREGRNDLGRIHALWTLRGLGQLDEESVTIAMDYATQQPPRVREQAARLAEDFLVNAPSPRLMTLVIGLSLATNNDEHLVFQQALTLGYVPSKRRLNEVTGHCYGDYRNEWSRAAILSSTRGIEAEVLSAMMQPVDDLRPTPTMLRELAFLVGAQNQPQDLDLISKTMATKHEWRTELELRSTLIGLGDGLKRSGSN
ncbi:MAG: dehydrogenase, partial [Candidatus Saccharimonas sp.]|nr:dehydrogenase [Planctomycetaceae bacterium]